MSVKYYNTKIIQSSITEIYEYGEVIAYNFSISKETNNNTRTKFEDATPMEKHDRIERMKKRYLDERWKIARLVDVNFDNNTSFLTLTFKENIDDIDYCNLEFTKFIKRLNYHVYKSKKATLKYIAVWEKQNRGAIHYHIILFSVPKIDHKKLIELWEFGSVNIKKIDADSKENRGRYISKYFSKNLDDPTFLSKYQGKKRYFYSRNLEKPMIRVLFSPNPFVFEEQNIMFQKVYYLKKKIGDDWIEIPVKYTKLK